MVSKKVGRDDSQVDLFLPQLTALPLRDQRETMERPFFSLSKRKRLKPIDYVSPDGKVTVHVSANSEYGLATIYDLDVLIYCASVLIEHKRRGVNDIPQTLHVVPYDMLSTLKRDVGGRAYELLGNALDRLQSTTVKTNIRSGDAVETTFSWIDSHSQLKDRNGQVRGMRITLAKWFYDGVLMEGGVLAIDPAYFSLTGGRERWLYRVARKHAGGAGPDGFSISMPTLYEKSGAEGDYRRFKFEMTKIARENSLPGYSLELLQRDGGEPFLRMAKRALDEVPSPSPSSGFAPAVDASKPGTAAAEEEPVSFPLQGSIAFGAFGAIARANLPSPQRDHEAVANDFRNFLRSRDIAFDASNITQIFATFCTKQRSAI
ncbi:MULTISPECIES: replication initiator protein A [unclassified Sphingobium]|uniref:replication initiator protein A n=1 Tax=unclassified Sphingobium TaxID=2611147 RepID=UPI0005CBA21D|nr:MULTISPECIES: replication initiator protein A [unclassified Sphingobium]AJR26976.1 plasmid replication initiator protein [Sphingobium sp. YBL2]QPI75618.1 replication initiator protein A [Sphingobium sp. Cam5-1]UZW57993.1 replication initiator protein A [Sphingobium sp. JS3065]